jgi:Holliday junction resolvasome RuvABC endonuclease subunit
MLIVGIDPGPSGSGIVVYDTAKKAVVDIRVFAPNQQKASVREVCDVMTWVNVHAQVEDFVAIERVQSYGISGGSLLRTAEVCGRIWQAASFMGFPVRLIYRREVLRALDVTGKGNRDSLVRARLIEAHGGTRQAAQGTKKNPGPLYGVAGDVWAALAVAEAARLGAGEVML